VSSADAGRQSQAAIYTMQVFAGLAIVLIILFFFWLSRLRNQVAGKTQQIQESEEKYRLITENTSDVIWIYNHSTNRFTYISPSIYQLRGFTPEEALQQNLSDAVTPESLEYLQNLSSGRHQAFIENPNKKIRFIDEIQQYCKSGDIIWVETSSHFQYNAAGDIETHGISSDITDRRRAEEALRQNEKLLRQIADNYPNSYLAIIEEDFTISFSSGQEFKRLNLIPKDFNGASIREFFGEKAEFLQAKFEEVFAGKEQDFTLLDNTQFHHYRALPLYAEDGSIPNILVVAENITERKLAEQALENHQLRRRAKITSHFETAELIGVWFDSVVPGRQEIVWMKI